MASNVLMCVRVDGGYFAAVIAGICLDSLRVLAYVLVGFLVALLWQVPTSPEQSSTYPKRTGVYQDDDWSRFCDKI